jgi:hypothetical protein
MAGENFERQENGIVKAVDGAYRKNKRNPITLVAGKVTVTAVVNANKYMGRQAGGSEPYTDVILILKNKKVLNLSCKGESAPSLAGGGLKGIELAIPGLARSFFKAVHSHLLNNLKLNPGDKVPDVYGQISLADKLVLAIGNEKMGGPIDFMYIGPMTVQSKYDAKSNVLTLNGNLIAADEFARTHDLYFRLRARREDQRFDPDARDAQGTPKIYGKSPSKGDSAGRLVVTDAVPKNAVIIKF